MKFFEKKFLNPNFFVNDKLLAISVAIIDILLPISMRFADFFIKFCGFSRGIVSYFWAARMALKFQERAFKMIGGD